jgi:ligand-binding sensor domain-containing protein/signal transduction histidine kinase/DNA-binding NarL/FixJ family response regulator
MTGRGFLICGFLQLILSASAFPQIHSQRLVKKWGVKDGLSQGVVNSVVQDNESFVWLATEDGLNRFDGYSFRIFRYDPDKKNSIPDNFVQHLFKDAQGNLWVSSRHGLLKFDSDHETFQLFQHNFEDTLQYSFNDVSHISEGSKGNLWIGWYGSGFASFDPQKHSFKAYTPANLQGLKGSKTIAVHEDKFGLLWVGTQDGGLSVFQVSSGKVIKHIDNLAGCSDLASLNIHCIAEDKSGNIWIGTSTGLFIFKRNENQIFSFQGDRYAVSRMNVMSLLADADDNLWIGTQGAGLFQLDLRQFNTRPLSDFIFSRIKNLNDVDISKRTIQSIQQDKDKNLWIGTFGDGVYFMSNADQNFTKIQKAVYDNTAVSFMSFYGMCYDQDGTLWLGTDGNGILKSDVNGTTIRHFTPESTRGALKDDAILSALRDHASNVWFGTYSEGIFRYLRGTDTFKNYRYRSRNGNEPKGGNDVRTMFEDSRNNIWVGTNRGGLCLLDMESGCYSNPDHFSGAMIEGDIRAMTEDENGDLWVGFYGDGVYRYSPDTKKFTRYFYGGQHQLRSDIVFSVKADRHGRIWIGTGGGGLCVYNPEKDQLDCFTEKDGLLNNTIYALLIDNNDNVWMTTNSGISKFEPAKNAFYNFNVSDGLQEGQYNPGSAMYNPVAGFMCMGGTYGMNILYPDRISGNLPKSEVVLSGLSLFNKPVKINDASDGEPILREVLSRTKEVKLAYDQNVLTFDFVGLNYSHPEKNQYAYKLDGLDEAWNFVGSERTATYRYLKPGEYTFKVKVSNTENIWDDDYASVRVVITPPIWKTPYAYALYIICATCVTALLLIFRKKQLSLRRRLKIEKSQRKHERELVRQKLSFFTEVSHEFKTPLTLMIGPLEEVLATETGVTPTGRKLKMVYRNAHKLLNLINKLLDYRKLESGNILLRIREENVVEFVREIYVTFKELANHKNIEFKFQAGQPEINLWFDKEKLEMILNNIISNSFKYIGKGNEISINIYKQISDKHPQGRAVIKIRDNGIGIPKKHLGNVFDWFHKGETSGTMSSGIGLALAKRLVHMHKGEIFVESTEGSGSVFSIKIPMGKDHFKPDEVIFEAPEAKIAVEATVSEPEKSFSGEPDADVLNKKGFNTLLLIEDDEEIREFVREYFEKEYKIFEAENGKQGLEMATHSHPDLIISDIMMPEMDGIDFCRALKNNIKTSHIPVVLLTAKTSLTHHKEGIQTGADAYITKPFSPEILRLTVQNLLQARENLKRFYRNLFMQETGHGDAKQGNTIDEKFLHSVYDLLMANIEKPDFNINELCDALYMSRSLVYKKIKTLTGLSPVEYIRSLRMQEAAKLLKTRQYKVFEVVYKVGFTDIKYFRQSFTREFGHSPSDFIKQLEEPRNPAVESK